MARLLLLARCLGLCFLPALGGFISRPDAWYQALEKPPGNPPPAVFGPVWTALYTLMGLALYDYQQAARNSGGEREVRAGQVWFGLQLALNAAWSPVFFVAKSPQLAFLTIIAMLIAIVMTIRHFHKVSPRAAYLLVPYLLWVSFATYLNGGIVVLNTEK